MRVRAALVFVAFALAGCQSAAPPATDSGKPVSYGDWTVKQGGYVRVESAVVN